MTVSVKSESEIRALWLADKKLHPSMTKQEFSEKHGIDYLVVKNCLLDVVLRASKATNLSDLVARKRRKLK